MGDDNLYYISLLCTKSRMGLHTECMVECNKEPQSNYSPIFNADLADLRKKRPSPPSHRLVEELTRR